MANCLENYRIGTLPESAYYIPNFITEDEENRLLQKINSVPLPRWTQLTRRRLQTWPSALTKSNILLESPLPEWLKYPIINHFDDLGIFSASPHQTPNHVLINEYEPGQGIMPHEDGPAYYPIVATVSLAAPIILDIYDKRGNEEPITSRIPKYRILQEPRSLLVTTEKLYVEYMHGISDRKSDQELRHEKICNWAQLGSTTPFEGGSHERRTRISLTYRDVLRVSKLGNTMTFLNRR